MTKRGEIEMEAENFFRELGVIDANDQAEDFLNK